MSQFARVRDPESGHEFSMNAAIVPDSYEVLDEEAVDTGGRPYPPKYAPSKELTDMTKAELEEVAAERGVDLTGARSKADMADAIQAATPQEG